MADHHDASDEFKDELQPTVERSQFGVSKKPKNPVVEEFRAPMTSSELSKGPEELTEQRGTKVKLARFCDFVIAHHCIFRLGDAHPGSCRFDDGHYRCMDFD